MARRKRGRKSAKSTYVSNKIKTILRDWKRTGKIGTSQPKNMRQAQRQAVAVAYSMAKKKGYRAEDEGPILTRDKWYELQDEMMYMVSAWLNECSYEPHIIQPLAQYLTPAQLQQLRNNINNGIWPNAEVDFADQVMDLLDGYVTEDEEDAWIAESFESEGICPLCDTGHMDIYTELCNTCGHCVDGCGMWAGQGCQCLGAESFEANGFPDRNPLNPTRPSDPQNPFERRRRRPKRPLRAEGDEEFSRRLDKVIQQKRRQHTKRRMSGRMRRRLIREGKRKLKNAEGEDVYVFDTFARQHGVVSNKMLLASIAVVAGVAKLVEMGVNIMVSAQDLDR